MGQGSGAAADSGAPGEAQAVYLVRLAQQHGLSASSLPLPDFGSRVARAVREHPDSLAALAAYRATIEATRELEAARWPQISAQADTGHRQTAPSTVLGNPARNHGTGSIGLSLRQYVYDFGATPASIAAGQSRELVSLAQREGREADLAWRAVQVWLNLFRSRELLELSRLNVQARQTLVNFLGRRHELGAGLISDVWRAKAREADARAALASASSQALGSEAVFRELFREAPPRTIRLPALPWFDRASLLTDPVPAVEEFPAVRIARAGQRAAESDLEARRLSKRPSLALEWNTVRRELVGSGAPGTDHSAALVLRYAYGGGADEARTAQASFRVEEATEQLRRVSAEVRSELEQALADEHETLAVLEPRSEAVILAADSLRAVREIFANRRGSLLDLLNAQEVLHLAGLSLVEAQVAQALARWRVLYFSAMLAPAIGMPRPPAEPQQRWSVAPPSTAVAPEGSLP